MSVVRGSRERRWPRMVPECTSSASSRRDTCIHPRRPVQPSGFTMKSPEPQAEPPASRRPEAGQRTSEPGVPTPAVYPDLIAPERVDPDAVKVLRRLARHEHTAYLVGGGVRDLLLGRAPKDFDIATSARPNEMRRLFRNCRIIGRRF